MGPEIAAALLGIPVSWFAGLTYDKIKTFVDSLKDISLEDMFVEAFKKALDAHKKEFPQGVKQLRKAVKENQEEFIEIFSLNIKDYNSLIAALQEKNFHDTVARQVVEHFQVEESFREVMVIILRECLTGYRAIFLKTISEKQAVQLILLLQGQSLDITLNSVQEMEKNIIAEFKKALKQEALAGAEIIEPKPPPGKQIKILSITASPGDELQYEREQDTLLQAFQGFDRERVFLDMPDPVKDTLTEIEERLQDGKHDILHITAHGSLAGKHGVLILETEGGKEVQITGAVLAKALNPAPKIVVLCSCFSASKKPELLPAAEALRKAGIESVIGMKKAISHEAAIVFNREFLTALCQDKTIKEAFQTGKDAILKEEEQRLQRGEIKEALKEYEIPQLLSGNENLTAASFSEHRIAAPGRPQSHQFLGARYLERGFIGRRQILRRIYRSIRKKTGAVVLKGPGGIGKSTLTTRVTANLYRQDYEFIVVQGETSIEQILEALSQKAAQKSIAGAAEVFAADADEKAKLGWYLENYLLQNKVVIIFDNFELNQQEAEDGDFTNEKLKEFLWFFRDSLKDKESFLFFSTRYTLPGFTGPDVCREIGEFSTVEFRKMLLYRDALKNLEPESIKKLQQQVGGNPRALELLDKIAYEEFAGGAFSWPELAELIPGMKKRMIEKKGAGDDFTPLFLDRLFDYLSPTQRKIIDILSIFRIPVPREALPPFDLGLKHDDRRKLTNLSLLERRQEENETLYYIHRLTARHLLTQLEQTTLANYHQTAAAYFAAIRNEEGAAYLENDIEARWHYLQAGMWNEGASITFDLEDYLSLHGYPQRAMELLQELDLPKLNDEIQAIFYNRSGILHQHFGQYDQAIENFKKSLKIAKQIKNDEGTAANLHQIGMIHEDKGRYDDALTNYRQSLEIKEKIGDTKGIAKSLHQIGIIYQEKDQYDEALKNYQQSLDIKEKIEDTWGVATSLHQIGIIYQRKGQYDEALKSYRQSLEIKEKIGDTRGIATSLHQIGRIYELRGQYDEALSNYQKALDIFEKIGNVANVAMGLGQMGQLYFKQEEFETSLKYSVQAFIIFNKIGSPYAKQAAGDIDRVREKVAPERFAAILAEFGIKDDEG